MSPRGSFVTQGLYLNKLESPCHRDDPCLLLSHLVQLAQWFLRRSRLKEKLTDDADIGRIMMALGTKG